MKQYLLLLIVFIAGMMPAKADNITVNGTSRSYNVYAPKNLGENRPLLIFCHGYNQDANWMQNSEFKNDNVSMEAVCDTAKFVAVFPNGINKSWDTSGDRDINFIKAIIDKMVTQHKIDRNRVYLGGFSMGGMLTYHAMNKIPDLIAAFCPVSGYPMGGATANTDVRAIPILHIHGTSDETCAFSGAQPALNVWIKHNGCPTTAKVKTNYNGFNGAKMHTWGPGNDGVEVRLLELPNKGHWICKEPQVYTGKEIWNFCKRFSLNKTTPNVKITSPTTDGKYICFAPKEEMIFPDITITATADDPNGTVEKVEFYDGTTLIATCTAKPYTATLTTGKTGKHTLKAIATDNDGETSSASVEVTLQAPTSLTPSSDFKEANSLPVGWTTYDSSERRTGYSSGYSSGCRVLQFTGSKKGFSYGLYFRNINGKANQGWAKFGLNDAGTTLSLAPGHYTLKYKICNWNMANFGSVDLRIEKRTGSTSIASQTYTPDINIGNVASNDFSSPAQQTFEFDITEQGDYVIAIYSAASEWSDCIVGQLNLTANSYVSTGIKTIDNTRFKTGAAYDLTGRQIGKNQLQKGVYIRNGRKTLNMKQ
jgi:poly(3-hydroxybutyrate) depolymerase